MKAVAYIRVSDASQLEGHSLDAQERLFRELCNTREWDPVAVYREEGRSAKSDSIARRPVLRKLLEDAGKGVFSVVVVHTIDRWARNLRVSLETQGILARHGVMLVSITEQIDHTTPEGRFMMQMLGGLAELYSGTLAKHVQKGVSERAHQGRHLGGVPFGYLPCSLEGCDPEHPGGVHVVDQEAAVVCALFKRYVAGNTTTVHLAAWLNQQGHRTRNRHRLGADQAQPRLFTVSSVRGILHNAFYTGQVKHRDGLLPGAHEPLISQDVFEHVQHLLQRNSGRSRTLTSHPQREYLLKGLVRCAQCGLPMWAQTFKNGRAYYREHRGSRGVGACTDMERSIPCQIVDNEVGRIVASMTLPPDWLEQVLERINLRDEVARVRQGRQQVQEKMRRLAKAYMDNLVDEDDYERQKLRYEMELESLVVPAADAVAEAGRLVQRLPELWAKANITERRKLLLTVLDAVYVDMREGRAVVSVRPKAAFEAVLGTTGRALDSLARPLTLRGALPDPTPVAMQAR